MRASVAVVLSLALALACNPAPRVAHTVSVPATSAAAPQEAPVAAAGAERQEVALAVSTTADAPTKHLPTIAITRREVRLLGDAAFAMPTPDASSWERGMPPTLTSPAGETVTVKRNGPNDLLLLPLAGWLTNVRDEHDVSIIVDEAIPYRLLVEVLFTCAQANLSGFHLVVLHDKRPGEIVVRAPHVDSGTLSLPPITVLVASEGVSVKSDGANVAPGCRGAGPGLAVAHAGGAVDQAGLRACLRSIGDSAPAPIQASMLAANPATPFSQIVAVLDALRASGVTDVSFGLAR